MRREARWCDEGACMRTIMVVESFEDPTDVDRALELGAVACLHKPPEPKAVQRLVETLADSCTGPQEDSNGTRWRVEL